MRNAPDASRHPSRSPEQDDRPSGLEPGTRLGAYEILSRAGSGGMGEVFKARDTRLDRIVAIKILPRALASSRDANARLQQEARAVASLQHPNICTLHDVGNAEGVTFLVLEYLEGETLERRLTRGALALDEAIEIAIALAGAIAAAHGRGIIHRDLKPSNVLLTRDGPKLLDFGLAKLRTRGATEGFDEEKTHAPRTRHGSIMGTLHYLSPEQLEGGEVDHRSDMFGFGCLLYELVTRKRAFSGDSPAAVLASILRQPVPPLSEARAGTPAALEWLVARCLEKKPENRPQAMADVRQNLEFVRATLHERSRGQDVPPQYRARTAIVAGLVVLAAAVAGLVVLMRPARDAAAVPRVHFHVPLPAGTAFWPGSSLAVSPDGGRVAFTAGDANESLWVRDLGSANVRRIPHTESASHPFWSPDGTRLGFFADGALKILDFSDSPPRTIAAVANGAGATWNGEDVIVFSSDKEPMQFVSARGGSPRPVLAGASTQAIYTRPQFLADGRRFLYLSTDSTGTETTWVASVAGGAPRRVSLPPSAQVAGSHVVFERGGVLYAQRFDADTLAPAGDPWRLGVAAAGAMPRFSASADVIVFQPASDAQLTRLVWVNRNGTEGGTVDQPAIYSSPALSPDGRFIAVGIARESTRDIWLLDSVRGTRRPLTTHPADDFNPVWSPDGETILYTSNRAGHRDIYRHSLTTGGTDEVVVTRGAPSNVESWSGEFVIFNTNDGARMDLWFARAGEWKPQPLIAGRFNEREGVVSPDGRWLAFTSDESDRLEVYVTTFPTVGRRWQISNNGGVHPQWRRDGGELYYIQGNALMAVETAAPGGAFVAGQPTRLFARAWDNIIRRSLYVPDVSGRRFLVNAPLANASQGFDVVQSWASASRP